MITQLRLKTASSLGQPPLVVEPPPVTIFVGPNNSGKSQLLREIFNFCSQPVNAPPALILDALIFARMSPEAAQADLDVTKATPTPSEPAPPEGYFRIEHGRVSHPVLASQYIECLQQPNTHRVQFTSWYLSRFTVNLDGPGRIALVNPSERGDLKRPKLPLAQLLTNDDKRSALRKAIHDAIGLYFAIDASNGNLLQIRFGSTPPTDERSYKDVTLDYMRAARGIDAVSDGVKAYTGILVQLYAGDPKVIIIDEPEAFLHPSLASKLGKEISAMAAAEGKKVFAATHSPEFVMGAVLSNTPVNIIRLTYENDVGTARLLPSAELVKLMQDPLLRSVGVLAGLFYNGVVVTEADADRSFYREINERLLAAGDSRGIPHVLFLNADNVQTIARIVQPLRKLGIPCAAAVDIDIIGNGGQEWTRHLEACNVPALEHQAFSDWRSKVFESLKSKGDFKTCGGTKLLSGPDHEAAENLFDDLARYGLFVVRRGELEAWLSNLDVPRSKNSWLRSIFERMGADPSSSNYVRPAAGDVWDFMGEVGKWLADSNRHGIPK